MKTTKETYDKLKTLKEALLDDRGRELPNPVPLSFDAGLRRPLTLQEQIQRVLKVELSRQAQVQGYETFEESMDFDVEDPFESEALSRYEVAEDEIPVMVDEDPPSGNGQAVDDPEAPGDPIEEGTGEPA